MKIAVFVKSYPKLSETFIRNQVKGLNAKVYCQLNGDILSDNKTSNPDLVLGDLPLFYKIKRKLLNYLNYYYDPIPNSQKRILSKTLINDEIDIVLIQYGSNAIKIGHVCEKLSIPYVIHFHGYDLSSLLKFKGYKKLLKGAIDNSKNQIVVNSIQKQLLIDCFRSNEEKISIIPCGVDIDFFKSLKKEYKLKCTFIMIGRLTPKKAPLLTLKAFEMAASKNKSIELIIIGEGPQQKELESLIIKSKYKDNITYLGKRNTIEIREYLSKSDVFLQHSITAENGDMEGWPISIAEACAMGLPIISTNHSGIKDQIMQGVNGYLVDEFDIKKMSEKILKLSNDINLRVLMGNESRNYIEKNGDLFEQIKKLKKVLN